MDVIFTLWNSLFTEGFICSIYHCGKMFICSLNLVPWTGIQALTALLLIPCLVHGKGFAFANLGKEGVLEVTWFMSPV